jgi:subtilase family serine protease
VIRKIVTYFFTIAALVISGGMVSQVQAQSQILQTRHVRDAVQNGQAKFAGPLSAADTMRIVLVLPLRDPAGLDNFLKDLYDPSSASFRQFLSVEEFTEKFGPTQQDYDTVIHFAEANGLKVVGTSRNRLNIDVIGTVAAIDKALNVKMGVYQHPTESRTFFAPDREPTPALSVQLWHIAGLDNYSIPHPAGLHKGAKSNATTGSGPSASFLGSDMRAAYYGGSLTGAGQSLGLLEYYGTDLADLQTYYKNAGQTYPGSIITLLSTDGTSTSCLDSQGCDDTEQTLDMTQALGMAPGMSSLVMYVGSTDSAIFNSMATHSPLNAQLSSSWTWSPADPSTDNPYFTEFAAQGQNLFQAAGDSGVWKSSSEIWPSDSVYVTSVGGTDLDTSSAAGPWSSETAWVDGGGGISPNKQTIPSWQTAAAAGCSACSKTYRNGPDVSANANFTFYVCADQTTCTANDYGGTSFATPMWAGYLALTNEQSVTATGKPLGFINPAIYTIGGGSSYDTDFHDITSGSNGDSATVGYDLATGWGSPNGQNLLNALAPASSSPSFTLSANPGSVSITQGAAGVATTITVNDVDGFTGSVTLSNSTLPSGVTAAYGTNPTTGTSTLTFTASATATTGTSTVTITGVSGSITQTTTVSLTVSAVVAGNYTLSASPTSLTIDRSASGTSTITITRTGGFTGAVSFTASGLGSGTTATFSPNPSSTSSSVVTFTASSSATTGTRTITITGTSGTLSHTTTISLRVRR